MNVTDTMQAMDDFADTKLDMAIAIVSDAYLGIEEDVLFRGHSTNTVFVGILNKLKKLKSSQNVNQDPPPIADGVIPLEGEQQ